MTASDDHDIDDFLKTQPEHRWLSIADVVAATNMPAMRVTEALERLVTSGQVLIRGSRYRSVSPVRIQSKPDG